MILIPVIDLAAGQVVHARGGERAMYPPLRSTLCRSSRPVDVVAGLLSLHPFTHLYIADLDAITRVGDQTDSVQQLHAAFPELQLWIDAGICSRNDYLHHRAHCPGTPVLGTETLADTGLFETLAASNEAILSLDFRNGHPLGETDIQARPALWPKRLICMSLDRVGCGQGPDLARLQQLRQTAPDAELYAAGGIGGVADLLQLQHHRVTGVLLASALHDGRIDAAQLSRFT